MRDLPSPGPCTCGGTLAKTGPHSFICRSCKQLWRDDPLPAEGFLTMVDDAADLPPWFTTEDAVIR